MGLAELLGRQLLDYIIAVVRPQVDNILVNANRNLP
jgi:molybdopterin-guanine dinucleotide biosynthesis protein A